MPLQTWGCSTTFPQSASDLSHQLPTCPRAAVARAAFLSPTFTTALTHQYVAWLRCCSETRCSSRTRTPSTTFTTPTKSTEGEC